MLIRIDEAALSEIQYMTSAMNTPYILLGSVRGTIIAGAFLPEHFTLLTLQSMEEYGYEDKLYRLPMQSFKSLMRPCIISMERREDQILIQQLLPGGVKGVHLALPYSEIPDVAPYAEILGQMGSDSRTKDLTAIMAMSEMAVFTKSSIAIGKGLMFIYSPEYEVYKKTEITSKMIISTQVIRHIRKFVSVFGDPGMGSIEGYYLIFTARVAYGWRKARTFPSNNYEAMQSAEAEAKADINFEACLPVMANVVPSKTNNVDCHIDFDAEEVVITSSEIGVFYVPIQVAVELSEEVRGRCRIKYSAIRSLFQTPFMKVRTTVTLYRKAMRFDLPNGAQVLIPMQRG